MAEQFSVTPTGDEDGADGIPFVANLNGNKTMGLVSRSVLTGWAGAVDEPLVHVFLRNNDRIEKASRLWLAVNPGLVIVLGSESF
jgi:hypothetical protein